METLSDSGVNGNGSDKTERPNKTLYEVTLNRSMIE